MKLQFTFSGPSVAALLATLCITAGACGTTTPITGEHPGQLSSLTIAPSAELTPPFSTTTTSYAATVPNDLPSIVVMANSDDSDATISINGMTVPAGANQSVSLGPPGVATPIEVVVSPSSGDATTYVITVTREAKCTPKSGDECCQGDYQEQPCGGGNCGKQSRVCAASGKWEAWSACGPNSARAGQVCRVKATVCDPAEVCGAAVDCPADYVEYTVPGFAGCWQDMAATSFHPGTCTAHACYPDNAPTAQRRCEESGYKIFTGQQVSQQVAGGQIYVGYWAGSGSCPSGDRVGGWCRVAIGNGRAMTSITCLK